MTKSHAARLAFAVMSFCAGCTAGRAEVDVTTAHTASFPGVPKALAARLPPLGLTSAANMTLDVKDEIDSLAKLGKLTAVISRNSISGPSLGLLSHIKVTMGAHDGKLPVVPFSEVDVTGGGSEVDLAPLLGSAEVLSYLQEGKVDLRFILTGRLTDEPLTLTHTLVAHVDIDVNAPVTRL